MALLEPVDVKIPDPFIKTAYVPSTKKGPSINHFNAVTLNVTGDGELLLKLYSKKEIASLVLRSIVLSETDRSTTRLANFKKERVKLEIKTNELGVLFRLNCITIYYKPVALSYPQV